MLRDFIVYAAGGEQRREEDERDGRECACVFFLKPEERVEVCEKLPERADRAAREERQKAVLHNGRTRRGFFDHRVIGFGGFLFHESGPFPDIFGFSFSGKGGDMRQSRSFIRRSASFIADAVLLCFAQFYLASPSFFANKITLNTTAQAVIKLCRRQNNTGICASRSSRRSLTIPQSFASQNPAPFTQGSLRATTWGVDPTKKKFFLKSI